MFELIVYVLMAIAVGVTAVTIASSRRAGTSLPLWPCFALAAFVLIEARVFVDTPSLTNALQAVPNEQTTRYISDRASGLWIGGGVTMLGLACAGVFFAGLARRARAAAKDSIAPGLILIGGAGTIAAVGTGAALSLILADAASSDRAPTTVAAVYTIVDSLGYTGFTAMGFVTGGVAVASFREHSFSRAVGWVSAFATGLFVVCTFLPFLSWAPALLWLFFAGIALLREEARRAPRLAEAGSAAA